MPRLNPYSVTVLTDVAVVVVTHNSAHVIEGVLESLPAALGPLTASVRVVDCGSTDDTANLASSHRPVRDFAVMRTDNVGYAGGINRGVSASPHSGAILVLNPDVRLTPGSVPCLYEAITDTNVGVVAPKLLDDQGHRSDSLRRFPSLGRALGMSFARLSLLSEYVTAARDYESPHRAEWATGAVLLMARACFEDLGGWDESYFLYSEETDFCLRAAKRGWITWYDPRSVAVHIGGQSGRNDKTHSMQIINRVRIFVRHHGRLRGWVYFLLTLASEASWVVRRQPQSKAAVKALLRPRSRPKELGLGPSLLPE